MEKDEQAKIIIDMLINIREKMLEFDMKEFNTESETLNTYIKIDNI